MDELLIALGPAFAAGFAVQRLMEIFDPVLDKGEFFKNNKKIILGLVSLIVGFVLAFGIGLRVLKPLGVPNVDFWDATITAFIVSAGTEGINSILKFLGYKKESAKVDSEDKKLDFENKTGKKMP